MGILDDISYTIKLDIFMRIKMSFLTKTKALASLISKSFSSKKDPKYIFILSHMRSRSSVLSHILGSNNSVCGYSELHNSYIHHTDIKKMKDTLYTDLKCDFRDKYLLDKILHTEYKISKEVFDTVSPKIIFLLRDPESTIKSIINMGYITGIAWYKDPAKASDYYCHRLSYLTNYAETFNGDGFFLESDKLINNTDQVLKELTKWLNLNKPLMRKYKKFNNTGKPGYGDPSDNIQIGELIKTKGYPDIEIPLEILQVAASSYEKCKNSLHTNVKIQTIK